MSIPGIIDDVDPQLLLTRLAVNNHVTLLAQPESTLPLAGWVLAADGSIVWNGRMYTTLMDWSYNDTHGTGDEE